MANKHRGYVPIEIGGTEYQLRFDFDALARLEQRLGQSLFRVLQDGNIGFAFIREALGVGLANPANGRNATQALAALEPAEMGYYLERIIEALEAAGILGKPKDEADQGEAPSPSPSIGTRSSA